MKTPGQSSAISTTASAPSNGHSGLSRDIVTQCNASPGVTVTLQDNNRITAAAMWLSEQDGTLARPIPAVQARFNLSAKEACEACAQAARMRTLRRAFG